MCERPLEEKLVGQQFAGSERDAGLAVDAHHGFLGEGFYVDVSDFFNARTAVFVASRVKQYHKHCPFTHNHPGRSREIVRHQTARSIRREIGA